MYGVPRRIRYDSERRGQLIIEQVTKKQTAMLLEQSEKAIAKKLKRQARRTFLQRERRDREKYELLQLRQFAERLEEERQRWVQVSDRVQALSWEQVVVALQEDATEALDENQKLRRQSERLLRVVTGMTTWIATAKGINRGPHTLPYTASQLNLHRVSLNASDPNCRQHGLDWMTKLLYHNTEALLERFEFWPAVSTEPKSEYHTDTANMDDLQLVWRFQVDIPVAYENVVDPVRQCVVDRLNSTDIWNGTTFPIDPEIVHQISPKMTYVRRRISHDASDESMSCNILYREFNDGDRRTVFVGQTLDDDKFEKRMIRSKGMTWVIVTRLGPSLSRVSILSLSSTYYSDEGFLPFEQQAIEFGITLDAVEHEKETSFIRQIQPICQSVSAAWLGYLNDAIRAAHRENRREK